MSDNRKKGHGLGRGLESLIPQDFDNSLLTDEQDRIKKLFISDVLPNPDQPRKHFDEPSLNQLADSIRRHGILQPLVVTPSEHKKYRLIAGERRWRAAQIAGLKQVPVIVRTSKELEQLEISLVENVQRVDLSPLEQAASIAGLHNQFSLGYRQIAERLGKAETTIINIVRLLKLPPAAITALHEGRITEGHARAILALKNEDAQLGLLNLIEKNGWTVRQAENYVAALRDGSNEKASTQKRMSSTTPETKRLSIYIKAPVTIKRTAKGGKLEITFRSDEDLDRIIDTLQK